MALLRGKLSKLSKRQEETRKDRKNQKRSLVGPTQLGIVPWELTVVQARQQRNQLLSNADLGGPPS